MHLVANWIDAEVAAFAHIFPVDQLDNILPLVDLQSMTFINFMGENYVLLKNHQCR